MYYIKTFHVDGSLPQRGEIFVFGSNLAGKHGAGAALVAKQRYGAKTGYGFGLRGHSFAIPTKDARLAVLAKDKIAAYIDKFCEFTHNEPTRRFFVTRVGCGLAGYENKVIAPLFKNAIHCSFPEAWKPYV